MNTQKNVTGTPLQPCSFSPKSGYMRDGFCTCIKSDIGQHTVCALMTEEFLIFSKNAGNDLSTPKPEYNFPGLKPGDQWCLCLSRWIEAYENNKAPHIILSSTNESVLKYVPLETLKKFEL